MLSIFLYKCHFSFTFRQTPPEKGWILDGFPTTINQARLFEKACTGIDPDETEAKYVNCGKLSLVTNPRTPNKPPVTLPAFDVSILLDISDTTVLKRVASLMCKFLSIFKQSQMTSTFWCEANMKIVINMGASELWELCNMVVICVF